MSRRRHSVKPGRMMISTTVRKKFTEAEDRKLIALVSQYGAKRWNRIAKEMDGRSGRQCRDRFQNYLNPAIYIREWTPQEDERLIEKIKEVGPRFKTLSKFFPGRSHNDVMNRIKNSLIANALKRSEPVMPPKADISAIPEAKSPDIVERKSLQSTMPTMPESTSLDEMFRVAFEGALNDPTDIFSFGNTDWILSGDLGSNDAKDMQTRVIDFNL